MWKPIVATLRLGNNTIFNLEEQKQSIEQIAYTYLNVIGQTLVDEHAKVVSNHLAKSNTKPAHMFTQTASANLQPETMVTLDQASCPKLGGTE